MKASKNKRISIIMFIGLAYACYLLAFQQVQTYKYNKQFNNNSETISKLEAESKRLNREKERRETDEYIEKLAREKLGYVKPGEKIYKDKNNTENGAQ